jgi:hypothetical protein
MIAVTEFSPCLLQGLFSFILAYMSMLLDAVRAKPVGLWMLDDDSPYTDYSGYNSAASVPATPREHSALASGTIHSPIFNHENQGQFAFAGFDKGMEGRPFSLEAVALSIDRTYTNLVKNPVPTSATNYSATNGTGGSVATTFDAASQAAKATVTTEATSTGFTVRYGTGLTNYIPVTVGTEYFLSAEVMSTVTDWRRMQISWRDSANTQIGTTSSVDAFNLTANNWTRIGMNVTAPAGAEFAQLNVVVASALSGKVSVIRPLNSSIYLRQVQFAVSTLPVMFFSGETENAVWNGTANDATSTLLVQEGLQQIIGHNNRFDGLLFDGSIVRFVIRFAGDTQAIASYDLQETRNAHVVGVYTRTKISLYVNGVLVDEDEITGDQQDAGYQYGGTTLYSGACESGRELAVGAIAVYNYPLSPTEIQKKSEAVFNSVSPDDVAEMYDGVRIGTGVVGDLFLDEYYFAEEDWWDGEMCDVGVERDALVSNKTDGSTAVGTWTVAFPLDTSGEPEIYGVRMFWEGRGITSRVTIDNNTWADVRNGEMVPSSIIPPGLDPTDKVLTIMMKFHPDKTENPILKSLNIQGYLTESSTTNGYVVSKIDEVHERSDFDPLEYREGWGFRIEDGALTISGPDDDVVGVNPQTVEIWAKRNTMLNGYLFDARDPDQLSEAYYADPSAGGNTNATAVYLNGEPFSGEWITDEWVLLHVVKSSTATTTIHIGQRYTGSGRMYIDVGSIVFYDTIIDAATAKNIYKSYVGRRMGRITANSTIALSSTGTRAKIIAADWTIHSGG